MTEKERIDGFISKYTKSAEVGRDETLKLEGSLEIYRRQGVSWTPLAGALLEFWKTFVERDKAAAQFLKELSSWIQRVEEESSTNRKLLIKLLGLNPKDASKDEIDQAIDQVGEIIAKGRRKMGGGA